jgi:hypothetical protein
MGTYLYALGNPSRRVLDVLLGKHHRQRAASTFTLRELLGVLEDARDHDLQTPPHLARLVSLVRGDLAVAVRYPERRGGPDTVRSLNDWRARYNYLDRYLPRG